MTPKDPAEGTLSPKAQHIANIHEWAKLFPESREIATRAAYLVAEAEEQEEEGFAEWLKLIRPTWVGVRRTCEEITLAAKGEVPKTE